MDEPRSEVRLQVEQEDGSFRCISFTGVPSARRSWIVLVSSGSAQGRDLVQGLGEALSGILMLSGPDVGRTVITCPEDPPQMDPAKFPDWRKLLVLIGSTERPFDDLPWYARWDSEIDDAALLTVLPPGRVLDFFIASNPVLLRLVPYTWNQSVDESLAVILARAGVTSPVNRVYISYRRAETGPLAEQLFDELVHGGFEVFLDRFSIQPGTDFQQRVTEELEKTSMLVLLESRLSRSSAWIGIEVDYAKRHRLALLSIATPDVSENESAPRIPPDSRIQLAPEHFSTPPATRADSVQWPELTPEALARVIAAIRLAHVQALFRRTYRLLEQRAFQEPGDRDLERLRLERDRADQEMFERNLNSGFILESLELNGVPPFENGVYQFAPRVNVLLGKNGYGKTLLLRAIAALVQSDLEHSRERMRGNPDASMRLVLSRNGRRDETVADAFAFEKTAGRVPLLAIPDARFVNRASRSVAASSTGGESLSRMGGKHFLTQEPYEGVVQDLLYQCGLDYLQNRTFRHPFFELIEQVVRELTEDTDFGFHAINRAGRAGFEILVNTSGSTEPLPIQYASQGTLSIVSIFGLIYGFLQSLPEAVRTPDVVSTPGIVIVDEVDAHLHPSWQQKLLGLLAGKFPNVQFIVSAHSPAIVAGCDRGEVSVLRRNESSGRFFVETLEGDFLGVSARELYQRVFEIEDIDRLYWEYSAKATGGGQEQRQREIELLEAKETLTEDQETRLEQLLREDRLIRRAEEVRRRRLKFEESQAYIEELESRVEELEDRLRQAVQPARESPR